MVHRNARLTPLGRLVLCQRVCEQGWTITRAARAAQISRQCASKWVARFRAEGTEGLRDRSSRPRRCPARVAPAVERRITRARLRHRAGPHWLSWMLGIARSTIYAVLRRLGLNRLRRLEPRPEVRRYEWARPGDLVHLDTKKLGRIRGVGKRFAGPRHRNRGIGWNFVHVAVDDHSRLAYAEELPDERGATAAAFLGRALAFFAAHGIEVRRVLTDNGSPYLSGAFRETLAARGIAHRRTRPYTPRTNGKAEAMVKLLLNRWAYRRPYTSSSERRRALGAFLRTYNYRRPHGGLNGSRPIDRVRH